MDILDRIEIELDSLVKTIQVLIACDRAEAGAQA